jgi:hypothetical protein
MKTLEWYFDLFFIIITIILLIFSYFFNICIAYSTLFSSFAQTWIFSELYLLLEEALWLLVAFDISEV